MWNDTDTPLAYLITFRTYGTWLHGDERGSVNRFRNVYNTKRLPKQDDWIRVNSQRMGREQVILNAEQRRCVEEAIKDTCQHRGWAMLAVHVRTNHAHCVTGIGEYRPALAL